MSSGLRPIVFGAIAAVAFFGALIACAVISAHAGESIDPTDPNHVVVTLRNDRPTVVYVQLWTCEFGDRCSYRQTKIGDSERLTPGEVTSLGINGVRYRFTDPTGAVLGCLSAQLYPNVEPPETILLSHLPSCPG